MKTIFRNFLVTLSRFKLASALNILGLSFAFAAFIIILVQVKYEKTFDASYEKSGRIYRVESTLIPSDANLSSQESYTSFWSRPLIDMLLPAIPQIQSHCIMYSGSSEMYAKYQTPEGNAKGIIIPFRKVSDGICDVFTMNITEGNTSCLSEPGKALMPESLAKKIFGKNTAIDKQITQPDGTFFTIGGVYKDFPENSSIVNDVKISMGNENKNNWMEWAHILYVVLAPDASAEETGIQLTELFDKTGMGKQMGFEEKSLFRLKLIEDIYYSHDTSLDISPKGNRMTTNILLSIAFLVIIIAALNFLNFSTALTPARIRSINIQKILGESATTLRVALISEALSICIVSFLLALCWVFIFNVTGLSSILLTSVDLLQNKDVLITAFILAIITGITAGIYPAFHMTSFRPAFILKGMSRSKGGKHTLQFISSAFQFTISTGLIIATLFIWLQNNYMHNRKGIMNDNHIATVILDKDILSSHGELMMEKLKSYSSIEDVSYTDWSIGFLDYYPYAYAKSPENENIRFYYLPVHYNFIDFMKLDMIAGRGFEKGDATAQDERMILNETAAQQFNLKPGDRLSDNRLVIGIVKDFNFMNLRKKIEPMALSAKSYKSDILYPTFYIRTTGNRNQAIEQIKACIAEIDPLYPVDIKSYDQQFKQAYEKERKTSFLITLFCILAVFISLMGVFGLVTFETQYRRKEISIRKITGATTSEILFMFNKKFIRTILISFPPAIAFTWYGVNEWLQSFAYRIPLYWWVFILAFLIIMLITLFTVTIQCRQIAASNPVHSLKSE